MTSLTTFWQALADALDDRESVALTGGSATTAVSSTLISADPGVGSGLYADRWIFQRLGTNATQQRKVTNYDRTTGTLTVPTWLAVGAGATVDLTSLFPVLHEVGAETDYITLCNRGLARMTISTTVQISIGAFDIVNMSSYPSLQRPEQLVEVSEPSPISGGAVRSATHSDRGWRFLPGYPSYLKTDRPFLSSPVLLDVEWTRPANTWISTSGTFGEATALVNQTDQALPSVNDWLPFALEEALTVLIARSPGRPNGEWLTLLAQAKADVERSPFRDRSAQSPAPAQVA